MIARTPCIEGDPAVNRVRFKVRLDAVARELRKDVLVRGPIFQTLEVTMKATADMWTLLVNDDRVIRAGEDDDTCKPRRTGTDDADHGLVSITLPESCSPAGCPFRSIRSHGRRSG